MKVENIRHVSTGFYRNHALGAVVQRSFPAVIGICVALNDILLQSFVSGDGGRGDVTNGDNSAQLTSTRRHKTK